MSKIAVCGLVNVETTVSVDSFPINYRPVDYRFFGINSAPSGVGLNVASALNTLGDEVVLCSLCGGDSAAKLIKSHLVNIGINTEFILSKNKSTAQSVVLYDNEGKRFCITDLTDNQELCYDENVFRKALTGADIACLCNINYAASLIPVACEMNVPIATDVHCLSDIYDEYNSRFLKVADIVFLSNEHIMGKEKEFVLSLANEYDVKIIVVGMGSKGALLYEGDCRKFTMVPAVYTRPVVNTIGAGDSLYSAFIHFYADSKDAYTSLCRAVYFASYKIGDSGASKGFLSESELLELIEKSR